MPAVDGGRRPFDVAQGRPEQVEGRPLKILHVDPERGWGGGERQVIGLIEYLARRGHANHLLCRPDGALARAAEKIGTKTHPLKLCNDFDLRPVWGVRRLIRDEAYDVIHFHTKRAHALSLWLGGASRAARVVTRRMDYPPRGGWYDRRLYNREVDGVVAISRGIASILAAAGVRREKIRVIHSGVDPAPFEKTAPARPAGAAPVVGSVAVLEERKGHGFLLAAAAELKRQGRRVSYRIAGTGSEEERLRAASKMLGLGADVEFAGFIADVPAFLSTIDVFVLPSLFEGLGVAALEAMAAAKPVVASDVGGLPELVLDGRTGRLVPPGDAPALARAIAEILERPDRGRAMGEEGRTRVTREFTMERMAEQNESYYYELIEARSAPGVERWH